MAALRSRRSPSSRTYAAPCTSSRSQESQAGDLHHIAPPLGGLQIEGRLLGIQRQSMTTTLKCSRCGNDLASGDGFCANCGAVCRCPECQGPLTASESACSRCGAAVDPAPPLSLPSDTGDSLWTDLVERLRRATLGEFELGPGARPWRHGGGLSGARDLARPESRDQGDVARAAAGRRHGGAVPSRGHHRREPAPSRTSCRSTPCGSRRGCTSS